ncbi:response regulator transcription factor [Szabonella alba]|uniref:Response regulator transcription factor n=1 Tax=Szabonella alba TaxID=2804194 RepID=A0A8K0VCU3_9RHOB|nr:response regulator transcription factor [Szabonella alba]MBL4916947.1 response regulator transcription factor [Szabonella alba]
MNILLVEDNLDIGEAVEKRLQAAGHLVVWNSDGCDVDRALEDGTVDAVILDLTLPKADGITILRQIRQYRQDLPVLVITAKAEIDDKVSLLDLGADDYLVKPFDMREMEARLRALVRRPAGHFTSALHLGGLELDAAGRIVSQAGRLLDLGRREFGLLEALMSQAGRVVTRERLMSRLSDLEDGGSDNALELLVSRLRRKIAGSGVEVVTVRGVGYLLRETPNEAG